MPSNFTARVLEAVELEESRPRAPLELGLNWPRCLPRIAVAAAFVLCRPDACIITRLNSQRIALAQNVALVAGSQPLPSVDALENLDAIQRMSQPRADEELLALLQ